MHRVVFAAGALLLIQPVAGAVDYQQGIDVSHWQGSIDWTAVKNAGIKFAFAKATEGVDFVDVKFHQYMAGATAAGVPIGPYHFARLNSGETIPTDAVDEAHDFVDAIQSYYSSSAMIMRPVLDFEQIPNDPVSPSVKAYVSEWIRDFSDVVQSRLGFRPIVYTCCGYQTSTYLEPDIAQHDLWIVKLTGGDTFVPSSEPTASTMGIWSDWKFWQWSHTGNIGGISPVDRDAFEGTMEQLAEFMPTYHAGDFNRSGTVDAADYVFWRKTMGQTVNIGTAADGNLNGSIDADDVRVWEANFGKTYGSDGGSDAGLSRSRAIVPEPAARSLIAIAGSILIVAARRPRARLLAVNYIR